MTGKSTPSHKLRAVLLAAVMVMSVFGMTLSFAGAAAAASPATNDGNFSATPNTVGEESTHDFNVTVESGIGGSDLQNITVDYTADSAVDSSDDLTGGVTVGDIATLDIAGNDNTSNIEGVTSTGSTLTIELTNATTVLDGDNIDVAIDGVTNPDTVKNHSVNVTLTNSVGTSATAEFTGANGLTTAPIIEVTPNEGVVAETETQNYTVSLENGTGAAYDGDVSLTADGGATQNDSATTTKTTGPDGEVDFTLGSGTNGTYDLTFTEQATGTNTASATLSVTDQGTALIDGEISDTQLRAIENSDQVSIKITADSDSVTNKVLVNVSNVSDFDTLAQNNQYVEDAGFVDQGPGQIDQYFIELATFGETTYTFEGDLEGFESFDGTVTRSAGQSGTQNIRLTRIIATDQLNVVDPANDPESVDIESELGVTVEALTEDDPDATGPTGLEGVTVTTSATITDDPNNEFDDGDIVISPSQNVTDADGLADYVVDLNTSNANLDNVDEDVEVEVTFTSSDTGETVTQNVTFVAEPPSGDGTIAGDVRLFDEDIQLGAQSNNADSADGVTVHAVSLDRVQENTASVNASAGTEYVRVIDDETGEVLDVQTDYLVTSDEVGITANTSLLGTGFDVTNDSASANQSYSVHVLESGDYTIQTSGNGTFTAPTNVSTFTADNNLNYSATEDRYADVSAIHTDVTGDDGEFTLTNLYTNGSTGQDYVVIAGDGNGNLGFANGYGYDNVTVNQNAQSGQTDVSLGVQQVDVQADSVDIENVGTLPSADNAGDGYEEIIDAFDDTSDDTRQTIPRDGSTVDVVEVDTFLDEGDVPLGTTVTLSLDVEDGETFDFDGEFLNTAADGDVVSHTGDTITIDTSDGNAAVFLQSDSAGFGEDVNVTINAEMEDAAGTDATDKEFEGVLSQSYQSGSITGVVTDDQDNPVDAQIYVTELADPDANIIIDFEPDSSDLESFTATVSNSNTGDVIETVNLTADEMENFEFQGFDSDLALADGEESFQLLADRTADRTTLDPVPAIESPLPGDEDISVALSGVSQTGATGTSVATTMEVNRTSTGSIVIAEATGADFQVSDLTPADYTADADEQFTVSATVENAGDLDDTKDVELRLDGDVVATQSVDLAAGSSTTVDFDVDASTLAAGDYTHEIATEDDSESGSLTVNESSDDGSQTVVEQYDTNGEDGIQSDELAAAFNDFQNDELGAGGLSEVFNAFQSS